MGDLYRKKLGTKKLDQNEQKVVKIGGFIIGEIKCNNIGFSENYPPLTISNTRLTPIFTVCVHQSAFNVEVNIKLSNKALHLSHHTAL